MKELNSLLNCLLHIEMMHFEGKLFKIFSWDFCFLWNKRLFTHVRFQEIYSFPVQTFVEFFSFSVGFWPKSSTLIQWNLEDEWPLQLDFKQDWDPKNVDAWEPDPKLSKIQQLTFNAFNQYMTFPFNRTLVASSSSFHFRWIWLIIWRHSLNSSHNQKKFHKKPLLSISHQRISFH